MRLLYVIRDADRIGGLARSVRRVTKHVEAMPGVEIRLLSLSKALPEGERLDHDASFSGQRLQIWSESVIGACRQWQPDLLVGYHGTEGGFAAATAGRMLQIPSVVALRGNDVNLDFFSPMGYHPLQFAIRAADAVTVVSTEMAAKVRGWFGVEPFFIANSVDTRRFKADPQGARRLRETWQLKPGPVAGVFGEFKPSRGLATLSGLERTLARANTLLIGNVRARFRRRIPDWVQLVPYITDDQQLCAAYTLCDLVLQPSQHDGMPNVVLEAMACERVVVASTTGGLTDLIEDGKTGFLCQDADWPDKVRELLAAPPAAIGPAARGAVPSPLMEATAFMRVFEQVLNT